MPHIHLQTTANLVENTSIEEILEGLVAEFCTIESVSPAAVKAYHSLSSVWVMGEGAEPGFAACTISVLEGRSEELRVKMADQMFAALQSAFAQSKAAGEVNLTLEIREMDRATYRK
jgi:5-carboxymethyl-2-hydroxymuconate isomerase